MSKKTNGAVLTGSEKINSDCYAYYIGFPFALLPVPVPCNSGFIISVTGRNYEYRLQAYSKRADA